MAKHGKRRKFRRYLRGQVVLGQALGALASGAGIVFNGPDSVEETAWCSSVKATYSLNDWTDGDDEGPLIFGIAHSDYTLAEIEEWIESTGSWSAGDLNSQEISRRKIRRVGSLSKGGEANDGKPIRTKCGWMLTTGDNIAWWVWNPGVAPLTTGADFHVDGHANLWPTA